MSPMKSARYHELASQPQPRIVARKQGLRAKSSAALRPDSSASGNSEGHRPFARATLGAAYREYLSC